ncbi:type II toxin-antitoxin system HicA family toxin [Candidatus Poribacteria bacterium]|nr:MAG: type II toxin-antitoxin system HicA family toxin [Candidatus Poribacteria bacterium]
MTYQELTRKLRRFGCHESGRRTRGSHRKWFNPNTNGSTSIPDHGRRDLPIGTVRAIVRQLGLNWEEFNR